MLGGLSRAVLESTQSMGRGLSSAGDAVAGLGKQSVQGMSDLAAAASGGVAKAASGVMGAAGAVVGALALSGGEADPHAGELQHARDGCGWELKRRRFSPRRPTALSLPLQA